MHPSETLCSHDHYKIAILAELGEKGMAFHLEYRGTYDVISDENLEPITGFCRHEKFCATKLGEYHI